MRLDTTRISKTLSYYLRHAPEELDITLDKEGYVSIALLLSRLETVKGIALSLEELIEVVDTNKKKRFSIRDGDIRANQGHSTEQVNIDFNPQVPTTYLYHGTTYERWAKIQASGALLPMTRQYVHLSANYNTAKEVSKRWKDEAPIILQVDALKMVVDIFPFYISENGVWLTKEVPLEYLSVFVSDYVV